MRDMPEWVRQGHKRRSRRAEVKGPRGVEVVVGGHPEVVTKAEVQGQVATSLPVVLYVGGIDRLAGRCLGYALRSGDVGGNAENIVRAVVACLVSRRIRAVLAVSEPLKVICP